MDGGTDKDPRIIRSDNLPINKAQKLSRAAFRQFGGKWSIGEWIGSFFPAHATYVEPFGGAFSVGLVKLPAAREIYNDCDANPVNFFRQLQLRPGELIGAIAQAPKTIEDFNGYRQGSFDLLEQARNYYLYCQLSWMGGGGRWNSGTTPARVERCSRGSDEHLIDVARRIQDLEILEGSASGTFAYDSPSTLFYLDPPYPFEARASKDSRHQDHSKSQPRRQYRYEMTNEDHVQLSHQVKQLKGFVVVSGYDCPLYRDIFGDWVSLKKVVRTSARKKAVEYLYLSPTVVEALPPEHIFDFHVGDLVQVVRGCAAGQQAPIQAINYDLKHSIELNSGKGRYAPNSLRKVELESDLPPEHFSRQAELKEHLNRLAAECDRIRFEGDIAAPGSYIERYIARRRRKKTAAVEYVYWRLRNPSGGGPKHQNLGKKGSPKYQAAAESISRRNQISQLNREIKIIEKQLAKASKADAD